MHAQYTAIDVDAATVNQLSKYVLDYAPQSFTAAAGDSAARRISRRAEAGIPPAIAYQPAHPTTCLLDARVGRRISRNFDLFVDGTNLFDVTYQEIAGVAMPGAAVSVSLAIAR